MIIVDVFKKVYDESKKVLNEVNNILDDVKNISEDAVKKASKAVDDLKKIVEEGAEELKRDAERVASLADADFKKMYEAAKNELDAVKKELDDAKKLLEDAAKDLAGKMKDEAIAILFKVLARVNKEVMSLLPEFKQSINRSDWMSKIDGRTALSAMSIPGSHDAVCNQLVSGVLLAQTQVLTIKNQLKAGIRYFDIRGTFTNSKPEDFDLCHDKLVQATTFRKVIEDFIIFLDNHADETILMQLKCEGDHRGDLDLLTKKIIEIVGVDRFMLDSKLPLLGEARGKIVVLQRYDKESKTGGMYLSFKDNELTEKTSYAIQDFYEVSLEKKGKKIEEFFKDFCLNEVNAKANRLMLNFLSLGPHNPLSNFSLDIKRLTPLTISLDINRWFLNYINGLNGNFAGVTILDGIGLTEVSDKLIELLIYQNYKSNLAAYALDGASIINAYLNVKVTDSIGLPSGNPFSLLEADQNMKAKKWHNYYSNLVSFKLNSETYVAGQTSGGFGFFIQRANVDGTLGELTLWDNEWNDRASTLTVLNFKKRVFILGVNSSNESFIREVVEGGKLADEAIYSGAWENSMTHIVSFSIKGKTFVAGQSVNGYLFFTQEVILDTADNKESISFGASKKWQGPFAGVHLYISDCWKNKQWSHQADGLTVLKIDNKVYLLGVSVNKDAKIWEVSDTGDLSSETLYEKQWSNYYPKMFSFNKGGKTYVAGQSTDKKTFFIEEVFFNNGKLQFNEGVVDKTWIFNMENLFPVQIGEDVFLSGQIKEFV